MIDPNPAAIARETPCPECGGGPPVWCNACRPPMQPSAREPQVIGIDPAGADDDRTEFLQVDGPLHLSTDGPRRTTDRTPDDVILAGVCGTVAGFLFALLVVGVVRMFG